MKDPRFLPKTPEARLWHLAEEIVEALELLDRSRFPMSFAALTTLHHHACSCGRFGMRADLTGEGERLNNAALLLGQYRIARDAFRAVRQFAEPRERELLAEIEDVERCLDALEPYLQAAEA